MLPPHHLSRSVSVQMDSPHRPHASHPSIASIHDSSASFLRACKARASLPGPDLCSNHAAGRGAHHTELHACNQSLSCHSCEVRHKPGTPQGSVCRCDQRTPDNQSKTLRTLKPEAPTLISRWETKEAVTLQKGEKRNRKEKRLYLPCSRTHRPPRTAWAATIHLALDTLSCRAAAPRLDSCARHSPTPIKLQLQSKGI